MPARPLIACVLSLMAGVATARSAAQAQRPALADLIGDYRHGDADAAVAAFATWPRPMLDAAPIASTQDPWTRAARLSLELEALMRATTTQRQPWPDRPTRVTDVTALAETARTSGDTRLVAFALAWCQAFESYAARFSRVLGPDDEAIQRAFPHDAELYLIEGAISEQGMGPLHLAAGAGADPENRLALRHGDFDRGRAHDAEAWMRRALELKPDLLEARLHLGRILFLLSRDPEARTELERTRQEAQTRGLTFTAYLADLFLGQMDAENGRAADADAAYRRAEALVPGGQTAYLAHAQLQLAAGAEDEAWAIAARAVAGPSDAGVDSDPFYLYPSPGLRDLTARLTALRAMVRQ